MHPIQISTSMIQRLAKAFPQAEKIFAQYYMQGELESPSHEWLSGDVVKCNWPEHVFFRMRVVVVIKKTYWTLEYDKRDNEGQRECILVCLACQIVAQLMKP